MRAVQGRIQQLHLDRREVPVIDDFTPSLAMANAAASGCGHSSPRDSRLHEAGVLGPLRHDTRLRRVYRAAEPALSSGDGSPSLWLLTPWSAARSRPSATVAL